MTTDAGAAGVPRFDVVLRGYDRRQVDEHVSRMQRTIVRMRSDLEIIRSQPLPAVPGSGGARPTPNQRPDQPDMIGNFTDRMQGILQAAEEEAAEIRNRARAAARAEEERAKAQVADLTRQRDALLAEIANLRSQASGMQAGGMLAAPTSRMQSSPSEATPGSPAAPAPVGRTRGGAPGGPGGPDSPGERPAPPRPRPGPGPSRGGQPGPNQPGPNQPGPGKLPSPGPAGPPGRGRIGQPDPARANAGPQPTTAMPAPTTAMPVAQAQPGKSASHRLPNAPYPTAEGPGPQSMRPRGEPDPEPSDLFRPPPGGDGQRPNPNAGNAADRTAMARSVEPGASRGPAPARGPADGAATRKVDAVPPKPGPGGPGQGNPNGQGPGNGPGAPGRGARPGDPTLLSPRPTDVKPADQPNGRRDQGPNGADRAGRPTSGSRQS